MSMILFTLRLWGTVVIIGAVILGWFMYRQDKYMTNPRYCLSDDDCVPVGCQCHCSGCGGFSYEDVVKDIHVDEWYEEHNCSPPITCPMVCCEPMEIVCEHNMCKIKPVE
jgi:hypothetical protein